MTSECMTLPYLASGAEASAPRESSSLTMGRSPFFVAQVSGVQPMRGPTHALGASRRALMAEEDALSPACEAAPPQLESNSRQVRCDALAARWIGSQPSLRGAGGVNGGP